MSEPDAFRWIQKTSMDQRVAMRAVAERVLEGNVNPGGAASNSAADAPGTAGTAGATPESRA
jgi:response regulator NasT